MQFDNKPYHNHHSVSQEEEKNILQWYSEGKPEAVGWRFAGGKFWRNLQTPNMGILWVSDNLPWGTLSSHNPKACPTLSSCTNRTHTLVWVGGGFSLVRVGTFQRGSKSGESLRSCFVKGQTAGNYECVISIGCRINSTCANVCHIHFLPKGCSFLDTGCFE